MTKQSEDFNLYKWIEEETEFHIPQNRKPWVTPADRAFKSGLEFGFNKAIEQAEKMAYQTGYDVLGSIVVDIKDLKSLLEEKEDE